MSLGESILQVAGDKGVSALVGIVVGSALTYFANKRLRIDDRNAIARENLERRRREAVLQIIDTQIAFLERRLNEFLWPLSLCLRIDGAIWTKIPELHAGARNMPTKAGQLIETQTLLPNHYRAVSLIEKNFHLVADEGDLILQLIDYVQHVAVFKALRTTSLELNPIDVEAEFPAALPDEVQRVLAQSLSALCKLRITRAEKVAALSV